MGNILSCWHNLISRRPKNEEIPLPPQNFNPRPDVGSRQNTHNTYTVPDELPSSSDLIIGIDFGTTFTGAAYAHTSNIGRATSLAEMGTAADRISVIKTWPNQTSGFNEKTPSVLAYNRNPPTWGSSVKPTDEPRVAYFKLGLQEDVGNRYQNYTPQRRNTESVLGGYLSDSNWKHPKLPEMEPVNYVIDFLSGIVKFIKEEVLPNRFGAGFLQNQRLSYVITVPAIWTDKAKELTRTAAVTAGIKGGNLTLITEPEAAALYCATLCNEMDMESGDRFMICDAGGGTVDLIVYKVLNMFPFEVEECTIGTGATCGAMYLDQRFEALVRRKFERAGINLSGDRRLTGLVQHFDTYIKPRFNPLDSMDEEDYDIPIGMQDIPSIGLRDGMLTLTKRDLQEIFDPIFDRILELVRGQMDTVIDNYGGRIKTIFLVGGLGSNQYLLKFLESRLRAVDVKQPGAGYTAIMRGAVLHKLGLNFVRSRMIKASYGTENLVKFEEGRHPESRRVFGYDGIPRCDGVMHWFVKKGLPIVDGTIRIKTFYSDYRERGRNSPNSYLSINQLWICDEDTPPEYMDTRVMKMHVRLTVDLKKLPEYAWEIKKGVHGTYRRVHYELGLSFGAGGIEWRFLYEGKTMGSVTCEYTKKNFVQ